MPSSKAEAHEVRREQLLLESGSVSHSSRIDTSGRQSRPAHLELAHEECSSTEGALHCLSLPALKLEYRSLMLQSERGKWKRCSPVARSMVSSCAAWSAHARRALTSPIPNKKNCPIEERSHERMHGTLGGKRRKREAANL